MSHLNDQRAMATALFTAAAEVAREISAEARARQARRRPAPPKPVVAPEPPDFPDDYAPDSCTCMFSNHPPCSWCTSDDNPINGADGAA